MTEQNRPRRWDDVDGDETAEHYEEYLSTVTSADAVEAYKRRSHRLLRPATGARILDVGCGIGEDALMLAELVGPDGDVLGVDKSKKLVETAQEQGADVPGVQFTVDDAVALSFPDDSFDAARADRVLQHLEAPADALAELRRVTRPGGRVGLSDPDWTTAGIDTPDGYSGQFLSVKHAPTRHPTMGRQLYRLARAAGLTDIDIDTWTIHSTEFSFLKTASDLDAWIDAMQAADEVTAAEVDGWMENLWRADERDRLFGSITGVTVAGTIPGQRE